MLAQHADPSPSEAHSAQWLTGFEPTGLTGDQLQDDGDARFGQDHQVINIVKVMMKTLKIFQNSQKRLKIISLRNLNLYP